MLSPRRLLACAFGAAGRLRAKHAPSLTRQDLNWATLLLRYNRVWTWDRAREEERIRIVRYKK
ncbi:hypothetical protein IF2G_10902 [Cordyceps javanica]|nr:hypothetical protein IF2G_10902 [Cordyceps javanica]